MSVIEMNPNIPRIAHAGIDDTFSGYSGTAYVMPMESTDKTMKPKVVVGSGCSGASGGPFDGVDAGTIMVDTATGLIYVRTLTGWKAHT